MSTLSTVVHFVLVMHYSYGIYIYTFGLIPPPEVAIVRSGFGGPFKYLTFINMLLQCVYFILALANDFIGSNAREYKRAKFLQKIRDYVFTTLVFSVGAFVTISFWTLWFINRELIFPKIFDSFFPCWLNHNIHTAPLFGVLLEMYINPHSSPDQKKGFLTVTMAIAVYSLWVCFVGYKSGYWVYPVLQKLPVIGRAAFIVGMSIIVYIFYVIGDMLNSKIWGSSSRKKSSKKSQ